MIYPLPAALISCGATEKEYNVLTASWVGTICSNPPMCYVSIRPERYSHAIVERNMAFVINLTTEGLARTTDWCGVRSGKDYDKFAECGLTPVASRKVAAPYIKESPLSIECKVREVLHLGSHDMFIADVEGVLADTAYIDPETGAFDMEKPDFWYILTDTITRQAKPSEISAGRSRKNENDFSPAIRYNP